jgi:3-oxoacyl-[acyl-carrier protein] reductase
MLITFEGKRVIVAGAARGIGHAIAVAFAENGGEVTACDRLFEEVEQFAGPANSGGGRIRAAKVDVTDKASIEAVLAQAGGPIDVLVYVAGGIRGQRPKPLERFGRGLPSDRRREPHRCVPVRAGGRARHEARRQGPHRHDFEPRRHRAEPHRHPGLCVGQARPAWPRASACDRVGPFGITVNTVAPGFLRTSPDYEPQWEGWGAEGQKAFVERIAMRRMGTPEDIAHAVMFLASDYASWITGQILPVMGSPT